MPIIGVGRNHIQASMFVVGVGVWGKMYVATMLPGSFEWRLNLIPVALVLPLKGAPVLTPVVSEYRLQSMTKTVHGFRKLPLVVKAHDHHLDITGRHTNPKTVGLPPGTVNGIFQEPAVRTSPYPDLVYVSLAGQRADIECVEHASVVEPSTLTLRRKEVCNFPVCD